MKYFIQIPFPERLTRTGLLGTVRIPNISGLKIVEVMVTRDDVIGVGNTIYDVRLNDVSIFANDAARPQIGSGETDTVKTGLSTVAAAKAKLDFVCLAYSSGGGGLRPTLTVTLDDEMGITTEQNSVQYVTGNLANNTTENGLVLLGRSFILSRVSADKACRIRIYRSPEYRTADAGRAIGVRPTGEHGLIHGFILAADNLVYDPAPLVIGVTAETPRSNLIAVAIENRSGAAGVVTVTFDKITLEK